MRLIISRSILWVITLISLVFPIQPFQVQKSPALYASIITLEGPTACPPGGCPAGQRLNFNSSFDLTTYQTSIAPNVQFCVYTPISWGAENLTISSSGLISGQPYTPATAQCGPNPDGYQNLGGVTASLTNSYFGDSFDFSLRIGKAATSSGSVLVRIFENDGTAWQQTQQAFTLIAVDGLETIVYVANQAADCAGFAPCYLNSKDDLVNGVGTGLKDAIDAVNAGSIIQVLGNYLIKSNAIQINKAVTLQGSAQASLSYAGSNCAQPMLRVQSGSTIRNLNLNDGSCLTPTNRDLLLIESAQNITLEQNRFTNGKNAVLITNSNGNVSLRFNHFEANSGLAILNQNLSNTGKITAIANNFINPTGTLQVQCAKNGAVDHNFWGTSQTPATTANGCTFTEGRQLGSPINQNASGGLDAAEITINTTKTAYFNQKISLYHPTGQPDFNLYVINHGSQTTSAPFQSAGSSLNVVPCNDYFDLFLIGNSAPTGALLASFKYDANPACVAVVESSEYCGQTNAALFPLWWYDPLQAITAGWDTTGQAPAGSGANGAAGQTTICYPDQNEITVEIDTTGRPGINKDLFNLPLVAGVIGQSASAVLSDFSVLGQDMKVQVSWRTSSELNTSGFYIQRSPQGTNNFSRISPFLARQGNDTSGETYEFLDTNVFNQTAYDYRLEIVGTDVFSVYSAIRSAIPMPATATPTVTPSPTITLTPTITTTPTITITLTATITPTPSNTATRTITPTSTRTRYRTITQTQTPYWTPYRTRTSTKTPFITRTPAGTITTTPTRTVTAAGTGSDPNATTLPTTSSNNGYPVPPGQSTQEAIQPTSDGTNSSDSGYPIPIGTLDPNATLSTEQNQQPEMTKQIKPTSTTENSPQSGNNKIVGYVVLGSMIVLSLALIIAFILWKRGILTLPF